MRLASILTVASTLLLSASAGAAVDAEPQTHRLVRVYDWTSGYPWSYAGGVEQDREGFLWVTTTSGLYRFDGARAKRIGDALAVAPGGTAAGRIIVGSFTSGTFEATPEGLVRLDGGGSEQRDDGSLVLAVASDGTPWRVRSGRLERLISGAWTSVSLSGTEDDPPKLIYPGRSGRIYVSTTSRVLAIEPEGGVRLIAPVLHSCLVRERADGAVVIGANQDPGPITTRIFEARGGVLRVVYEENVARLLSIVERGDTLWIAMDTGLQALGPGGVPRDRLGPRAVPAFGHLMLDHEGSLWMATARGLVQIPEPDAYALLPAGGFVTRDLARTSKGVWGTFWGKLAFFSDVDGALRLADRGEHYSPLCRDGAGRVWTVGTGGIRRLEPDGALGPLLGGGWAPESCGYGADGRRWLVSGGRELWSVQPGDDRPHHLHVALPEGDGASMAAEGPDGTLWIGTESRMCGAPAADVLAERAIDWRCESLEAGRDVQDIQPTPGGDVWAIARAPRTVIRRASGRWEIIPGARRLPSNWIDAIRPSPAGGFWVVGKGTVLRVVERTDLPDGWEIVERPTAWNGLVSLNVSDIAEDDDGTLWLGTDVGIQRIAPTIRRRVADPPPVVLVSGSVDGAPVDPKGAIEIPYRHSRLEAQFAALTYRDPSAVRYRMRLHGDDPWSAPATDGRFNFVDLPPGRYDLEVAASLDGTRWSPSSVRLAFRVARPWYANPWLIGGAAFGLALAGHLSYRLRARRRLAREHQRTRIAMDLHDEVGSGLGAIAVLAGIAARPDLPDARRADVLGRISTASQDLALSLGDIVWSLRTSSGFLDALWVQLVERARTVFPSEPPRLEIVAPDPVPHEALTLVVRRNLHLIVYEALHNARRHSGATVVALRLRRDGASWTLTVEDDGRGLSAVPGEPRGRGGLGLSAIRTRASEMGATIAWDRSELGGTRLTIGFPTGDG